MSTYTKAHKDRILVIAVEPQTQRLLKLIFSASGYQVLLAVDVSTAIQMHATHPPQLVVLDLDLRELSGCDAIIETRRWSDVPVVALSSRHAEADLIAALDLGADDYVEKPFRSGELLARVRSVLRRGLKAKGEKAVYQYGTLEVDILDHVVTRCGEPIRLAPTEFEILALLVRNVGRVVPYQRFLEPENGKHFCANKRALGTAIWALRQKIEDDPHNPRIVVNEEGFGYRLVKASARAVRVKTSKRGQP
jgi:two-component system KDP operon response regulator KdpE